MFWRWRLVAAALAGVLCDAVFFWKFQSYSVREHGPDLLPVWCLPIVTFSFGLLLTLAARGRKRLIPLAMFGGFCAAHACLIVADCLPDPTNHNLWPFEFVIIAVATLPAAVGAGISALIGRARQTGNAS